MEHLEDPRSTWRCLWNKQVFNIYYYLLILIFILSIFIIIAYFGITVISIYFFVAFWHSRLWVICWFLGFIRSSCFSLIGNTGEKSLAMTRAISATQWAPATFHLALMTPSSQILWYRRWSSFLQNQYIWTLHGLQVFSSTQYFNHDKLVWKAHLALTQQFRQKSHPAQRY